MKGFRTAYIALIIASIVGSFFFVYERIQVENKYRYYEMAIYYDTLSKLSDMAGTDFEEYLKHFVEGKIDHILIEEDTIFHLKSNPKNNLSVDLLGNYLRIKGSTELLQRIEQNINLSLKTPRKILFLAEDEILIEGLPTDIQYEDRTTYYSDKDILYGAKSFSLLEYVGLGFDEDKIATVKKAGGKINLSPTFNSKLQDANKAFQNFKSMMKKHGNQAFLLFLDRESYLSGGEDLGEEGFKKLSAEFRDFLVKNEIPIFLNENRNQRGNAIKIGLESMVFDPQIGKIRGFITPDFIQKRYDYQIPSHHNGEEIVNTYYRAISERNIAVVVITPFIKNKESISDYRDYVRVANLLEERLKKAGFYHGDVSAMEYWHANRYRKLPIAFGIVAASLLLLNILFDLGNMANAILMIMGFALAMLFYLLGIKTSLGDSLFNVVGISVYPTLALCYALEKYKKIAKGDYKNPIISYLKAFKVFIASLLICMIGNLMQISLLSSSDNMLELVIFRGVKITQLLPIFMLIFVFFKYMDDMGKNFKSRVSTNELKNLLNYNIKLYHVLVMGVGLVMLGLLLIRSGNTSIKISSAELLFRNIMEQVFIARPRTKAIFIGYPSIILLIYSAFHYKNNLIMGVLGFLSSIGFTNLMNTFSHIRTPLFINANRVIAEILVTIILSISYLVFFFLLFKIYQWSRVRMKNNEQIMNENK